MRKLILFLLFVPLISLGQKDYYVTAKGGLNVREAPEAKAKKVSTLSYGTFVSIESRTAIKLIINDTDKETGVTKVVEGEWVKIISENNIVGYIFDGFLKKYTGKTSIIILKYSNYRLGIDEFDPYIIPENQEVFEYHSGAFIDPCSLFEESLRPLNDWGQSKESCGLSLFEKDWEMVYNKFSKNKFLKLSYVKFPYLENKLKIKKVELLDERLKSISDFSNISSDHIITKFDECNLEDAQYQKQFAELRLPKLMGIEDEDKSIIWSCSKVHIDLDWDLNKNSPVKEIYDNEELDGEGEKIFYYAFKADNKTHIGDNYFVLKDDNTIILYDEITQQQNFDKSTREAAKNYRNLNDISELNKLNLYAYTREGKFKLEIIDSKINRLPIYCENEGATKQIEIRYNKINSEILFISTADLVIDNSFINTSPFKHNQLADAYDDLLFPSNSDNKNVTFHKFGYNNALIASVSANTLALSNPCMFGEEEAFERKDSPIRYNCNIKYPVKRDYSAYYYIEGDKVLLLSYFDDEIKGFQDINNDGILDIVMRKRIYFSNEKGFYIYNLITNQRDEIERC
jgi:hypothetical protein